MSVPPTAVQVLDTNGARQWKDPDGTWLISIPRRNSTPAVQQALREIAEAAEKHPCVLWVRRTE